MLRRSPLDCSPEGRAKTPSGGGGAAGQGVRIPRRPVCGSLTTVTGEDTQKLTAKSSLIAGGVTLAQLASSISTRVDRPVVDRTGLNGFYDADLTWAPTTITPDDTKPSIFTAVQEQLGLRLEKREALVEVLVVDSVELPTEN